MMANLNIEDLPDGTINVQAVFVDGFNKRSGAHLACLRALKIFEAELKQVGAPAIQAVDDPSDRRILLPHESRVRLPH